MILSFNARENHPQDKKVIDWYRGLYKSERSRKIVEVLYAHIVGGQHTINYEVGESLEKPNKKFNQIEMVDIGGDEEIDLESKLDNLGGGF
jgi:hypothetical protein